MIRRRPAGRARGVVLPGPLSEGARGAILDELKAALAAFLIARAALELAEIKLEAARGKLEGVYARVLEGA